MNEEKTLNTQSNTEPAGEKPSTKPTANTNKQKSGGALMGFFVLLTFLLAVAGIGAGYYVWQQTQQKLQLADAERHALQQALDSVDENPRLQKFNRTINNKVSDANQKVQGLGKELTALGEQQQQLAGAVKNNSDIVGRTQSGWMLKEVEHVLRMSQHRLLLDRDFDGALAGLKAADKRLNDINDVRLIPVRQSIAKQIQTLNQFPHPDYIGLQLQLENTMARLKSGLVKAPDTSVNETSEKSVDETQEPTEEIIAHADNGAPQLSFNAAKFWDNSKTFMADKIGKAKAALGESVNITRGEQKVALFIEEEEKKHAYDFLHNKLLAAKYSISTRDNNAYHQQLNAALAWLTNSDQFTNSGLLNKEISELNQINLMPTLPDITQPSALLTQYMNTLKDKK